MESKKELDYSLSFESIKNIPFEKYDQNFTFIVDGQEYRTSRFVADLISPKILQYHFIDESIDKFYINTKEKQDTPLFSDILSLISFDQKSLNENEIKYYQKIFSILGNKHEFMKLSQIYDSSPTKSNVFERILQKQEYLQNFSNKQTNNGIYNDEIPDVDEFEYFKPEIDFISSHFSEFDQKQIEKINIQLFECILKNENLKLEDEDSILRIVSEMYFKDSSVYYLFENINFLNVSNDALCHFFEIFDINDLNVQIWKSITERILKSEIKNNNLKKGIPFLKEKGSEFNGIIKYLTNKTGGNIFDNKTIGMTWCGFNAHPKNLLDFNEKNYYQPNSNKDCWFVIDFKNMKVKVTNYSIKSYKDDSNGAHLKSWDVEVSNDGNEWIKIDERRNCQTLNGSRKTGTFDVRDNDFNRYIRFHQTDYTWCGSCCWLVLYYLEIYGYLLEQ